MDAISTLSIVRGLTLSVVVGAMAACTLGEALDESGGNGGSGQGDGSSANCYLPGAIAEFSFEETTFLLEPFFAASTPLPGMNDDIKLQFHWLADDLTEIPTAGESFELTPLGIATSLYVSRRGTVGQYGAESGRIVVATSEPRVGGEFSGHVENAELREDETGCVSRVERVNFKLTITEGF